MSFQFTVWSLEVIVVNENEKKLTLTFEFQKNKNIQVVVTTAQRCVGQRGTFTCTKGLWQMLYEIQPSMGQTNGGTSRRQIDRCYVDKWYVHRGVVLTSATSASFQLLALFYSGLWIMQHWEEVPFRQRLSCNRLCTCKYVCMWKVWYKHQTLCISGFNIHTSVNCRWETLKGHFISSHTILFLPLFPKLYSVAMM